MDQQATITQLLLALEQDPAGDTGAASPAALEELFAAVYPRLRKLAGDHRGRWQGDATLNATALIHEAYLKVASTPNPRFRDRAHFFAWAARAMRHVLINHAEARRAAKRGGGQRAVTLGEQDLARQGPTLELLALDEALTRLEAMNERQASVVECLFFAGLNLDETADALEISRATVKRDWATARAWLFREIQADADRTDPDAR